MSLYRLLGVVPHRLDYYKQALHHKSFHAKGEKSRWLANNERLEFLGDGVLDAIVGHIVYEHFPRKREGFLTTARARVVQRESLNRLAEELGIKELMRAANTGSQHNSYMGGNAFEALVGALYLDQGYDACMRFMKEKILNALINLDTVAYKEDNFKSKLLEWGQKKRVHIEFHLQQEQTAEGGSPVFTYAVTIEGIQGGEGTGFTKKESQQAAAKKTLSRLRQQPQFAKEVYAAQRRRTQSDEETTTTL